MNWTLFFIQEMDTEIIDLTMSSDDEEPNDNYWRKCEAILRSGKRKGETCDRLVPMRTLLLNERCMCGHHKREKCSICYDDMIIGGKQSQSLRNCNHSFHKKCLIGWINQGKSSCPLCRTEMKKETVLVYV